MTSDLIIRYSPVGGVTLDGSSKGDGVYDVLRTLPAVTWRGLRDGSGTLYVRGSRDRDISRYRETIERTRAALEAAGHNVGVDITEGFRPAEQRRSDADDRAADRADALRDRADRAAGTAVAAREARRAISDGIPIGQPILIGHHSEGRSRRDAARMDKLDRRSFDAADKAQRLADRADGAESNAAHRANPRAIMRRIEHLDAQRRGYARELAGYVRQFRNGAGDVVASDEYPAAAGQRAEDLARWDARDAEEIGHLRTVLAGMEAAGTFAAWSAEHFVKGDRVNVMGRWVPVRRVNRKSVSVPGGYGMSQAGDDASWSDTIPWDRIHGRRRDGYQLDKPHGEPWPVELAEKVATWRGLLHSAGLAHQHGWDTPERKRAADVGYAVRLVHGLDLGAADAQVKAITDSITETDDRRALAAAYLAVFTRLQAGELVPDIAASLTPVTGAPAWELPTDREPVDRRPQDLHRGDLVAGVWGTGGVFGGSRTVLGRSFCGPVATVGEVRDRREAGEWVTVALTTGAVHEFMTHRWLAVFPAVDTAGDDPADAQPAGFVSGWAAVFDG